MWEGFGAVLFILQLDKMRYGEGDWLIDMAAGVWTVKFQLSVISAWHQTTLSFQR